MSKYTQGKLRAEVVPQWIPEAGDADRPVMLLDEQGREVAFLSERYDSRLEPTYETDANRLVSCWNALAGRDPAKLEDAIRTHRNLVNSVTDYVETPRPEVVTDEYIDELVRRGKAMGEAYSASIDALAAFEKGEGE